MYKVYVYKLDDNDVKYITDKDNNILYWNPNGLGWSKLKNSKIRNDQGAIFERDITLKELEQEVFIDII